MVKRNTGLSSTLLIQRATARVAFWRRLVRICRARFNPPASPRLSLAALSPGSIARLQQHHVRHIYQHASIAERTHNEKGRDFTPQHDSPSGGSQIAPEEELSGMSRIEPNCGSPSPLKKETLGDPPYSCWSR